MKLEIPQYVHSLGAHSGPSTPWQEAPLFAHECLGPYEGEEEPQNYELQEEQHESPLYLEQEEVIDTDDPLLEEFPQDRLSILAHVRSAESRLSEDETNFEAVPPSPLSRTKSPSPGFEEPQSTQLNAKSSPSLDIIAEERQEEDFASLPSPNRVTEIKQSYEMSGIERPNIGEIIEDELKGEEVVFCAADLTNVDQGQSGLDSGPLTQDSSLVESTEQTTSTPTISDAAGGGPVEHVPLITNIPETDELINEATIFPKANSIGVELQEQSIVDVWEATHGELIEHDPLISASLESSSIEPIEQGASIPGIGQGEPIEPLNLSVALPMNTALQADTVSTQSGTVENEGTNQAPFITLLHPNTENEPAGKECPIPSSPETVDSGPAKHTPSTTQTCEAPEDENVDDSPKSDSSSLGDRKPSNPEEIPNVQHSEDVRVTITTPAMINEIVETTKDELRVDPLSIARPDPAGRNLGEKGEELRSDPIPSASGATQDTFTTQTLPINDLAEIARNEPMIDTTPNNCKLSDEGSIHAHLAMSKPNTSEKIETPSTKRADVAESTSVEQPSNFDSSLKMRNPATTERSVTPASLRRPGKEKETRNFLQILWRTVFIQWIGGFFTRLCGGRHRP
jgi:hypothetical protein